MEWEKGGENGIITWIYRPTQDADSSSSGHHQDGKLGMRWGVGPNNGTITGEWSSFPDPGRAC